MEKIYFVTYRQVEHAAEEHFRKYNTKSDFKTIVSYLFHQKKFLYDIPHIPCKITWSQMDDTSFFQVLTELPIMPLFLQPHFAVPEKPGKAIFAESIMPENLEVFAIVYVRNIAERMHTHNFFEINYVFSGTCYMVFENEKRCLSAGDICIIAPGSRHDITFDDDTIAVSLMIRQNTFERTFFQCLRHQPDAFAFCPPAAPFQPYHPDLRHGKKHCRPKRLYPDPALHPEKLHLSQPEQPG